MVSIRPLSPQKLDGSLSDPNIPPVLTPFGIVNIDNNLFVS
jgi:hypothetical protein